MNAQSRNWFRGRKVLVLGGAGFIGHYLVPALARSEADTTILSNHTTVPHAILELVRLFPTRIRVRHGNICDPLMLRHLIGEQEVIYALAGKSGTVQSNENPLVDLDNNCRGLLNLLECCRTDNPKVRIVFPSSRLVYGRAETLPVSELYPTEPRSIYGIHKLTGEKYLLLYHQLYGIQSVIVRISNPYGFEHQPARFTHGIINHFFRKALQGEPLTVFGDGTQLRDYIHIDDVIEALLAAGSISQALGQVFNVGSGRGIKLDVAAHAVVGLVGSGSVVHAPWPPEHLLVETGDFVADIQKIRAILGWSPQTDWQEGLRKVHSSWLEGVQEVK